MSSDIRSNEASHRSSSNIADNLQMIRRRIATATKSCDRDQDDIQLIAVSKTKPVQAIEEACSAGHLLFGENYVQESIEKINYFRDSDPAFFEKMVWHFIGPLQSNKSRIVAENFDWLHTLDSQKLAKRLNDQRPVAMAPLNVLIQVNISQEESKSGLLLEDVEAFVESIMHYDRLTLRGLMAIPAPINNQHDLAEREAYLRSIQQLHHLRLKLRERLSTSSDSPLVFDTLSVGMSDDLELAIQAGSTMVRIGSAIFGAR